MTMPILKRSALYNSYTFVIVLSEDLKTQSDIIIIDAKPR